MPLPSSKRTPYTVHRSMVTSTSGRDVVRYFSLLVIFFIIVLCFCNQVGWPFNDLMLVSMLFAFPSEINNHHNQWTQARLVPATKKKLGQTYFSRSHWCFFPPGFFFFLFVHAAHMEIDFWWNVSYIDQCGKLLA